MGEMLLQVVNVSLRSRRFFRVAMARALLSFVTIRSDQGHEIINEAGPIGATVSGRRRAARRRTPSLCAAAAALALLRHPHPVVGPLEHDDLVRLVVLSENLIRLESRVGE
jgi:hypothetical protein